jgi:hypothetical protein
MKKLVILPGGYHPFHAGHKALYDAAREAFPSADVYVAATADTSSRPFSFDLKKKLARIAGIDGHRFIQVKSPFRAEEITQHYDPKDTQLIFARSEKDREQQPQAGGIKKDGTAAYLQPYRRNGLESMNKHGYMVYLPTVQFGPGMTSATEIRAKWPEMQPAEKVRLVQQLYPDTQQKTQLADVIVKMFDTVMGRSVDEGIGKVLATGALAGAMALGSGVSKAQTVPVGNTQATVVIDGQQKVFDMGKMDIRKAADMLEKSLESKGVTNYKASVSDGRQKVNIDTTGAVVDRTNEATLINDPDAGHLIRPDGGMGTYSEDTLKQNLARKFASMLEMIKAGDYDRLHYVLQKGQVVDAMVKALAEYQRFMARQGRRPMARGREIDMGAVAEDYIDEANHESP